MKKGKDLEKEVYETINRLINKGNFPFPASQCKVFLNKKYYSKDRDAYIETDVSIEVFMADATEPFFIWIWECKDYSRSIPVDDLEEFHAKLEQIGADNTKGTMITSNGWFQTGALNYARSKKIGLARMLPEDQVEVIMQCMTFDMIGRMGPKNNFIEALTRRSYKANMQDTFIMDSNYNFSFLDSYIADTIESMKK